jgi:hypothetical protein
VAKAGNLDYLGPVPIRLFSLLAMIALLIAPFGRLSTAEAMSADTAMAQAGAMQGHCSDAPAPDHGKSGKAMVDCMTACASVAPARPMALEPVERQVLAPQARPVLAFAGISLEAETPPPRFS